jgi:hypothetical protein
VTDELHARATFFFRSFFFFFGNSDTFESVKNLDCVSFLARQVALDLLSGFWGGGGGRGGGGGGGGGGVRGR